eukprot:scaffold175501_cov37-Prasinocladus_malaysianus.AAC.1
MQSGYDDKLEETNIKTELNSDDEFYTILYASAIHASDLLAPASPPSQILHIKSHYYRPHSNMSTPHELWRDMSIVNSSKMMTMMQRS